MCCHAANFILPQFPYSVILGEVDVPPPLEAPQMFSEDFYLSKSLTLTISLFLSCTLKYFDLRYEHLVKGSVTFSRHKRQKALMNYHLLNNISNNLLN